MKEGQKSCRLQQASNHLYFAVEGHFISLKYLAKFGSDKAAMDQVWPVCAGRVELCQLNISGLQSKVDLHRSACDGCDLQHLEGKKSVLESN